MGQNDSQVGEAADSWRTGPQGDRGRYRVARPEPVPGGQGFVFAAQRVSPRGQPIPVALKLIGPVDEATEAQLRSRMDAIAAHPHPRLAEPLELFRGPGLVQGAATPADDECDQLYLATRWVPGVALRQAAPLNLDEAAHLALDLAAALAHLHQACGLIYRDLHPGNVVVTPERRAVLIDLGALHPIGQGPATTAAGVLGFIPPEAPDGSCDQAADVWCLGTTVVYALLGHPQGRSSPGQLAAELRQRLGERCDAERVIGCIHQATHDDPAQRPTNLAAWSRALARALRSLPPSRRRLRRAALAAGVVLAAGASGALAVALGLVGDGGGEDRAEVLGTLADPSANCHSAVVLDPAADEALRWLVRRRAEGLAAGLAGTCVTGPAEPFGEAVVQPTHGAMGPGVVVAGPEATVFLTDAQWASYREIAGRQQPLNALTFGGYPVAVREPTGRVGSHVELSLGGWLVGERADTQSFWLPPPVLALWRDHGGPSGDLGLPMSNPHVWRGGLRQDFERGHLLLGAEVTIPIAEVDPAQIDLHRAPDPDRPLRGVELRDRILRQRTGTAWYVDEDRQRHWIVDGATWECLGGDDAVTLGEADGATVAVLPLGPPIALSCDG